MSDRSLIDYCDATWNPLGWGCYGPNGSAERPNRCPWCYAWRIAKRNLRECSACRAFVPHFHEEELDRLRHWRRPRRILVQSMGDIFGWSVHGRVINEAWNAMFNTKQHSYLLLTKQPDRLQRWTEVAAAAKGWPIGDIWPDWFWLGTSITCQHDADERIPHLLNTPAAHRWLSVEPLLAPIDLKKWLDPWGHLDVDTHDWIMLGMYNQDEVDSMRAPILDWVVAGAETGAGAVAPQRAWVESLVEQCRDDEVPVFMKRNLSQAWGEELIQELPAWTR